MKLTQMIEKFAKQGMLNGAAKMELLQAAEETEQEMAELQEALSGKDGELAENRKTARAMTNSISYIIFFVFDMGFFMRIPPLLVFILP